ncbi:MAG: hypothetical protein HC817_06495 [Saprospiraceae bacterium]|nr:hypothetical protein [Saprospiraceae bacterium]
MEAKRQMLLQQIDQTTQQLNQTAQSRRATRDRLEALQNQIENREALLINVRDKYWKPTKLLSARKRF